MESGLRYPLPPASGVCFAGLASSHKRVSQFRKTNLSGEALCLYLVYAMDIHAHSPLVLCLWGTPTPDKGHGGMKPCHAVMRLNYLVAGCGWPREAQTQITRAQSPCAVRASRLVLTSKMSLRGFIAIPVSLPG